MRRTRDRRGIRGVHSLLIATTILAAAWSAGFLRFVSNVPQEDMPKLEATRHHDAIVVLTGGSGRLEAGLALLARNRGKKLFVSGVYRGVDVEALLKLARMAPGNLECCIALGYSADDTTGNAAESAEWMAAEGFTSMLLVTANYHLPRSMLELRSAMPNIEITPWPVFPPNVQVAQWWRWPGTAKLLAGEYTKYLAVWIRVRLGALHSNVRQAWSR